MESASPFCTQTNIQHVNQSNSNHSNKQTSFFLFHTPGCHKFLYTCDNVLAVGIFLQGIQVNLNTRKNVLSLLIITSLQNFLYNIIGKLVFHHCLNNKTNKRNKHKCIIIMTTTKNHTKTCSGSFSSVVPSISFTKIWRSAGPPYAKHFSTTFEANFCWLICTICPASWVIIADRSCGFPLPKTCCALT